jgi:hypothetical protein
MKKIVLLIAFIALSVSCSDDITNLNVITKDATSTKPEYLFTNAQKALMDQMTSTSVNSNVFRLFVQHWTETTYPDESQYNITTRAIPDNHFTVLYRDVLRDLKEAKDILTAEVYKGTTSEIADKEALRRNKLAVIDMLTAYTYSILVDTFGNVPYTEAVDVINHPQPTYDDAKTIYKDLIARLTTDVANLSTSSENFGSTDLYYGGDATKWKKFANSLRLKLAVNISDADPSYGLAQIQAAVAAGVITNSNDDTKMQYLDGVPNTNPVYVDLVASGRHDFVAANTFVNKMNALSDPRRDKYFTLAANGTYRGGTYGTGNSYATFSHVSATIESPTNPGVLIESSEIEFLLAEAVERGATITGTAESHYNAAIIASMNKWGVASADITTYLARTDVAYTTATGTWKQKIGTQAWIALHNRGFEAWTSYRRLDFPVLAAPAGAYNGLTSVPVRYSYPAKEQTLNSANVTAAITAIGGNDLTTKLFWDKF